MKLVAGPCAGVVIIVGGVRGFECFSNTGYLSETPVFSAAFGTSWCLAQFRKWTTTLSHTRVAPPSRLVTTLSKRRWTIWHTASNATLLSVSSARCWFRRSCVLGGIHRGACVIIHQFGDSATGFKGLKSAVGHKATQRAAHVCFLIFLFLADGVGYERQDSEMIANASRGNALQA